MFQVPRGTKDIMPDEIGLWQYIEDTAVRIFELYNYSEIRTPIFEQTELFSRSIGTTTDIVEKEMYTFNDRKGRSLTLRPEGTACVVRSFLEHNLAKTEALTKLFYRGPMFRYERPQAVAFGSSTKLAPNAWAHATQCWMLKLSAWAFTCLMTLACRI